VRDLDGLLARLEELLARVEELDEPLRGEVFELLDGVDALHRLALGRLAHGIGPQRLAELRSDPAVAWLLDAYGAGVDQRAAAEGALEPILPYIHSHGGRVEILGVEDGIVRLRLAGTCSGCSAAAITLQEGVEQALRGGFPGFAGLDVAHDDAPAHEPPGPTLLQIRSL
jgi:Fe-S cluster biogenesis protein NfuA